jgi:two-component system, cell cycle response regulator
MPTSPDFEHEGRPASARRVIVVAESVPPKLASDPTVDVRIATSTLAAIGTLGELSDRGHEGTLVLVSPALLHAASASDLVEAATRLDPAARVGVLRRTSTLALPAKFHFEFDPSGDWATLRRAADDHGRNIADAGHVATAAPRTSAPASAPAPGTASVGGPVRISGPDLSGDRALVEAMLTSGDLLGPALDRLRRGFGGVPVDFVPALASSTDAATEPPLAPGQHAAPVSHGGRVFAHLVGPAAAARELADAAAWLASWLALREQHAQLKQAAFTDPLTGSWNRRFFDRFLAASLDAARADRRNVSILLFDIDNFKHFNDRWGHPAGDEILRETARLLNSVIRPSDRVCRLGGDEFGVIFDEPQGPRDPRSRHPATIFDIARRFQKQVESAQFPKLGHDAPGPLSISGGLATFPWDGTDPASLIDHADRLLVASKRAGKNAICYGSGPSRL